MFELRVESLELLKVESWEFKGSRGQGSVFQ